jgi:hypothetical protein
MILRDSADCNALIVVGFVWPVPVSVEGPSFGAFNQSPNRDDGIVPPANPCQVAVITKKLDPAGLSMGAMAKIVHGPIERNPARWCLASLGERHAELSSGCRQRVEYVVISCCVEDHLWEFSIKLPVSPDLGALLSSHWFRWVSHECAY